MFVTDARRIVLTYIPIGAIQVGISHDFAFYLIAIANGTSAFGRISAGFLADRVGECWSASRHVCRSSLVLTWMDRRNQYHGSIYDCRSHHDVYVAICYNQRRAHCDRCDIWVRRLCCCRSKRRRRLSSPTVFRAGPMSLSSLCPPWPWVPLTTSVDA